MNITVSPKAIALTFGVLAICFLAAFYVVAWQEPTASPPSDNVPTPLNVGNLGQGKEGGLILNTGGAVNGLIIDKGNVGIGTTTPGYKLDVTGDVCWTGTLQGGSVPWPRLTTLPSDCLSGEYVYGLGGTLKCSVPAGKFGGSTLTIYGSGTEQNPLFGINPCPAGWTESGSGHTVCKYPCYANSLVNSYRTCFRADKACLTLVNYGSYDAVWSTYSVNLCPAGWTEAGLGYHFEFTGGDMNGSIFMPYYGYPAYRICFLCQ